MPSRLIIHSRSSSDGIFVLYTSGLHPHPEFYAVVSNCVAPIACDAIYLLGAHTRMIRLVHGDCFEIGGLLVGVSEMHDMPPELHRCNHDSQCLQLTFFNRSAQTPPTSPPSAPPEMQQCPVCLEPGTVCAKPHNPNTAFTSDNPGRVIWCSNGHGTCIDCVRRCQLKCNVVAISYKCPVCRCVTNLSTDATDVLLAGSWHEAGELRTIR